MTDGQAIALARLAAERAEANGTIPLAHLLRRLASIAERVPVTNTLSVTGCPTCGGEVVQPARGRRRKFCSDTCRRNARNGRLVA